MSPPEFSIICRSHGGPTTLVRWELPNNDVVQIGPDSMNNYTNYKASTVILNTSYNCTYENTLRVNGIYGGNYIYTVEMHHYPASQGVNAVEEMINILGMNTVI